MYIKKKRNLLYFASTITFSIALFILTFSGMTFWAKKNLNKKILGEKSTSFINRDYQSNSENDYGLDYFIEPYENTIDKYNPEWLGKEVVNTINKDSLNERFEYTIEKENSTYRVITLGDSFTFGHFVNTSENWTERLEDDLNLSLLCPNIKKFEVINLGYPGYDLSNSSVRYLKRGQKYSPDLVIWLVNPWNIDNVNEYMVPALENLNSSEDLFDTAKGTRPLIDLAIQEIKENYGTGVGIEFHKRLLDQFFNNFKSDLIITTLEDLNDSQKQLLNSYVIKDSEKYNLIKLFDFHKESGLKLPDEHPNSKGHQEIAKHLINYLQKNNLSECVQR